MSVFQHIVEAAAGRVTGFLDAATIGYVTDGGTYIIASEGRWNDSGQHHDLVAVLPGPLEGSRVVPLRPTVNPDLLAELRDRLDGRDYAGPVKYVKKIEE